MDWATGPLRRDALLLGEHRHLSWRGLGAWRISSNFARERLERKNVCSRFSGVGTNYLSHDLKSSLSSISSRSLAAQAKSFSHGESGHDGPKPRERLKSSRENRRAVTAQLKKWRTPLAIRHIH